MIDWLTLNCCLSKLPYDLVRHLQSLNSKIFKVNAQTGEVAWETYAWESVQSDTHQVCFRVGGHLSIQGSPARVGMPNNAFGSMDIRYCARKMLAFVANHLKVSLQDLPFLEEWDCSRVDIACNHLMQSEAEARQALDYLKHSVKSRQNHSTEEHGLYIGKRSSLHMGKFYLKGQDAARNQKSGRAHYTDDQLDKSKRILRVEYSLRRLMIKRLKDNQNQHWFNLSPEHLLQLHTDYFREYFSDIEVTDMGNLLQKLARVAPTDGQARAAYDCYMRIRMIGYEQAKVSFPKTSWYRNIAFLKAAGLSRADLNSINVIPLQKRPIIIGEPVRHWDDIQVA